MNLEEYLENKGTPIKKEADSTAYDLYDKDGNYIGGSWVNKGEDPVGKTVYKNENGTWSLNQSLTESVSALTRSNTPKIRVNDKGTGLILSGSKSVVDSDMGKQLRQYLDDTFQYADLSSANVTDAINQLNQDLYSQVEQRVSEGMLKVPYEDYKEYKNTMQQFQGTNPLTSSGAVPGYTKDGKKIKATDDDKKTLADWLKYYQENYSAKERAELYNRSREAIANNNYDFALWTPYLVMSGGNMKDLSANPVYGFNAWDRTLAGAEALLNEGSARLIEGMNQTAFDIGSWIANAQGFARRDNLKNRAKRVLGTGSDITSKDIPWISEEAYNEKINSIKDKSVRALGKADKNFLAAALGDYSNSEIDDAVRNSSTVEDVLKYTSYNKYIDSRDNLSTVEKYDQEREKIKEKGAAGRKWLQEDVDVAALYAPVETTIGSFAGTMMRMWAEAGLISAATGGLINPAGISDALAGKFMSMLSPTGNTLKALQTPVGSFLLSVAAEVPEDLVQTVIDDVITGRAGDVEQLAPTGDIGKDMAKLGESFAQNLAFRLAFTPIHAGANAIKNWRAAKAAAKAAGIPDNVISDEYFIRNQQVREAADANNIIDVTKNSATVRNPDGTETVLDNVAMLHFGTDAELQERYPAVAEMLRKKGLVADVVDGEKSIVQRIEEAKQKVASGDYNGSIKVSMTSPGIPDGFYAEITPRLISDNYVYDSIIERKLPKELQQAWYIGYDGTYDINSKRAMFDAAVKDPELRNAALSKMFNEWKLLNKGNSNMRFEDWLDTEITLYHGRPKGDIKDDGSGVVSFTLNKEVAKQHGDVVDEYKIKPKDTPGILKSAWEADGIEAESEVFLPYQLFDNDVWNKAWVADDDIQAFRGQPYRAGEDFVYNDPDYRQRLAESEVRTESPDYGYGDAYFFTTYKDWAREFGDTLVSFTFKEKDTLSFEDYTQLKDRAIALNLNEPTNYADYAKQYGAEDAELMKRIGNNSFRAAAEYTGKPVIMATEGMRGPEWLYYKGVDKEFDESATTSLLASVSPEYEQASAANIEMANRIQQALDTEPYGRTIGEIVADKYKNGAATIGDAPNSSSYRWESPDVTKTYSTEAEVFADMPTGKNLTEVRQWEKNAHAFYMNRYMQETMPEFTERYPTVDEQQQFVRNMDYLFDLQRIDGETLESAVGKTFENEGVVYTVSQEDIDFYQNYVEPQMKGLREAGAAAIGKEAFTITGYLPHSDYDPTILTAEDSMQQGVLWREYTGASTTSEDGNFSTGWLNPDLTARYSTFVHNMLWDSLGDNVTVAKYMEEFNADGLDVAANIVEKMVGGRKRLAHLVSESDSVKAVVKNLLGDGELPTEAQLEKAAKDLGSTDIVHDLYRPVYGESKGLYQVKGATNVKLMSKADWMRSLATGDGTLYDNGGAMIVNGAADAKFLAKRITDAIDNGEKLDVHQMFVEYLMQNQRRTAKGAGYIADKWMDKIAQRANNGGISRRALTAELGNLIYGEGANRLFRFIGRMDTSQLTSANKQALDSLLFRHSALSKIKNTSGVSANINKWTNRLISARMKSLFWLNYKNGVLQASECIRLFTEFKFGDALSTINRLASDADFRARVDEWVDMLVPERFVKSDSEAATGAMKIIADNSSVKNGELTVNKMSDADMKSLGEKFNEFANQPVELGETMKNRVMMAGILQEAERKGLTGNELFNYVNQRFERIGLAANEMGRLNASDNPLFRLGANLKTFQIRQFRMFLNNIHDMNGTGEAATYIIKNLGWKAGLALIMGKLGYSTASTLGIDPFDLMDDDYTGVDEENYTGLDYAMASPVAKLFLSGGFTGYIDDAYWAARKAYEDSAPVTKQTEEKVSDSFWPGMKMPEMSFDNVFNAFSGFIPGFTAGKRLYQMNELMETGWATSASGNKMYQAPTNPLDVATGYVFGRSNTPNARAYYQTPDYLQGFMENGLAGIGQQLGREFGGYRQFDPIDTQNYSDWFNGTAADEQQWNSGYYYFRNKMDDLQKEYQNSLSGFTTDKDEAQLSESFNKRMAEIEEQLNKFTAAYEAKHPEGIDARKMRNLTTILNLYQPVMGDTDEERKERELEANSDALYRYTQAGLPAVTSYKRNDEGEVEPVYSPQLRSALQGEYGLPKEAAAQIRQLYNDKWKDLGKQYRDRLFSTKGTKNKQAIQKEYINIVRQDLDPIVRLYGNNIWGNEDVENIIDDVFNSMIPKYGQSAKSYLKGVYKDYTGQVRYNEKGNETLTQINQLLDQGKTAQAKALARTLRQRVQENKTSLTRAELERLQKILND